MAKGFLKLPNLHMLIKQKSPSLPRNLALGTFGKLLIVFSTKVDLLYLLYSNCMEVLSSTSDKAKSFAKNFYMDSNLNNSSIFSPVFCSRLKQILIHQRCLVLIIFQWWF